MIRKKWIKNGISFLLQLNLYLHKYIQRCWKHNSPIILKKLFLWIIMEFIYIQTVLQKVLYYVDWIVSFGYEAGCECDVYARLARTAAIASNQSHQCNLGCNLSIIQKIFWLLQLCIPLCGIFLYCSQWKLLKPRIDTCGPMIGEVKSNVWYQHILLKPVVWSCNSATKGKQISNICIGVSAPFLDSYIIVCSFNVQKTPGYLQLGGTGLWITDSVNNPQDRQKWPPSINITRA